MSELIPTDYDELNFFDLFETLWIEKWKIAIITFIALSISIIFNLNKDDVFEITVPLNNGKPVVFAAYHNFNKFSKEYSLDINLKSAEIFDLVVREFNDYQEMISILQKDEIVKEQIKDLDEASKMLFLMDKAKNFELLPGKPDGQYVRKWTVSAKWNDAEKAKSFINDALHMTLVNVKKSIFNQIDLLSKEISKYNQQELEILNYELDSIMEIEENTNKSRIQFLSEHAAVARELGIAKEADSYIAVQLQPNNLAGFMNERPFYLRGYIAIEKEILNIQSRSKEEQLLMSNKYLNLQEKILKLQNDTVVFKLKYFAENIKEDEINDWVEFDIFRTESKLSNKSSIYIFFSIIVGFILGCIYVLIVKNYSRYKTSKLKV